MTIREALQRRLTRVRLAAWEPSAHIELPLLSNGFYAPWATVRDVAGEHPILMSQLMQSHEDWYEAGGRFR